ncbi:hypothetical protein ACFRFJ_30690 [Streptomyces hydrogenans]|uniref:hypothetical protein n=1 Tax=Streptomyces hydrogenans TaxID=1873719 RepID=UPI0036BBAE4F
MTLQDLIKDVTTRDLTVFARAVPTPDEWTLTTGDNPVFPPSSSRAPCWRSGTPAAT